MLSVYISSISPSHTRLNMAFTCPAVGPHQHPRLDGEMPKRQRSVKPAMRSPEGPRHCMPFHIPGSVGFDASGFKSLPEIKCEKYYTLA